MVFCCFFLVIKYLTPDLPRTSQFYTYRLRSLMFNVNKKVQLDATVCRHFIYCKVTLHVSGVTAPIIRSTKNCNRYLWYRSYCKIKNKHIAKHYYLQLTNITIYSYQTLLSTVNKQTQC